MAATKTKAAPAKTTAAKPVARGKARAEPASGGTATMTMTKPKAAAKKAAPAKKGKKGC
jgi:hypothetical protein